jgi:hypothetical protein
MRREGQYVIALPLRDGASGNRAVSPDELIDATPLTGEETREFHDLDRELHGRVIRSARLKRAKERRDALRLRMIYAPKIADLLRAMRARQQRGQVGLGGRATTGWAA